MSLIGAAAVVLDGRVCRPGWVQTAGDRITDCGPGAPPRAPDLDFPGSTVLPGFVDMHVHGGDGASYPDADAATIIRAAAFHRRHGTTTTLASLVTAAPGALLEAVRVLADMTRQGALAGIHLEGPWLSPQHCGAHDREQLRDPDPAEIDALLAAGAETIRMVTLAPERPGSGAAIKRFVDAGVVVAVGHTGASFEQTQQAIEAGATVGTHLFNAMGPWHQRAPGAALALLQDPRVTVEVIADGVHLHPAVVRHVVETAGPQRVALITDATAAAGASDGSFRLGAVGVEVTSGAAYLPGKQTIAGSTATMDQLFRSVAEMPGAVSDAVLAEAVQMTSTTPAAALGFDRVGSLRIGYDADLVVLDRNLGVTGVMANGDWQVRP